MKLPYSNSRVIRRCAQLGIPYEAAIETTYFHSQGISAPQFRIQYQDGLNNTTGWGAKKKPIQDSKTTPHSLAEMRVFLNQPCSMNA
jgi:hypothetical protein